MWRGEFHQNLNKQISLFYNDYLRLRSKSGEKNLKRDNFWLTKIFKAIKLKKLVVEISKT